MKVTNPHGVTAFQVGLGSVNNTSDANKPVSTAQATAIADAKKAGTDAQTNLNTHTSNKTNPHGVTKEQVGLGSVPNVTTNDQTPTYSEASSLATLTSGEKLSVAFGKIKKAITDFISHLADTTKHITSTERTTWNGKAPSNHPSTDGTNGLGTSYYYGHTKVINDLTETSQVGGLALHAYQGKVLNDKINSLGGMCEFIGKFSGSVITVTLAKEYKMFKIFAYSTSAGYVNIYPPYTQGHGSNVYCYVGMTSGWATSGRFNSIEMSVYPNGTSREIIISGVCSGSSSASAVYTAGKYTGDTTAYPNKMYIASSNNSEPVDVYIYGIS